MNNEHEKLCYDIETLRLNAILFINKPFFFRKKVIQIKWSMREAVELDDVERVGEQVSRTTVLNSRVLDKACPTTITIIHFNCGKC